MITPKQRVSRQGLRFELRRWTPMLRAAWEFAGTMWFRQLLPKHFTMGAYAEYQYQPRSLRRPRRADRENTRRLSYSYLKMSKFGHNLPLIYTGAAKRMIQGILDVRASEKGARVYLHGPTYFYMYRKDLRQPDKAAELAAVSEQDHQLVMRWLAEELQRQIDAAERASAAAAQLYRPDWETAAAGG